MIEEPPLPLVFDDGMVVGSTIDGAEHNALIFEWAERRITHAISNARIVTIERTVAIREVILAVVLVHPCCFEELIDTFEQIDLSVVGDHVFVELDTARCILSAIEISLSVIIYEDARIDEVSVTDYTRTVDAEQRMSEGIDKGAIGTVAHCHTDMLHIRGIIEIILAVALHTVGSPGSLLGPGGLCEGIEDDAVILEMLHVGGREDVIVFH